MKQTSLDSETSYWLREKMPGSFPKLQESVEVDVAIVGGGIAGMTVAYVLKKAGYNVAVLEKNTIASGTTAGTTGKVTSQHGIIYTELIKRFGRSNTKLYANAYEQALADIKNLIHHEKLECEWADDDNYVYTADHEKIASFKAEAKLAASLGLPATFETKLSLPFPVHGAVKFSGQGRFNAAMYTRGLAELVQGSGSYVFEHSQAEKIQDGQPAKVATEHGSVTAKHIIIATKVPAWPLAGRFTYAAIEYPETSYIVAGQSSLNLQGMYISPDSGHYSILPVNNGQKRYILIGGGKHIPGLGNEDKRYKKLADYAAQWFDVKSIDYEWKAMDYIAYDKLPIIGKLYPHSKNVYAVSGFKKWGLSTSMLAANVIRDLINGQETEESKLFSPHRVSAPRAIPRAMIDYLKG